MAKRQLDQDTRRHVVMWFAEGGTLEGLREIVELSAEETLDLTLQCVAFEVAATAMKHDALAADVQAMDSSPGSASAQHGTASH